MRGMDATTGTWLDGQEHLMQSIRLILATPINTRVMLPEFGSDVPNLISAPMTAANRLRLYAAATEAITRWEPRITVKKVEVTGEGANGEIDLVIEGEYDGDVFSIPIINVGVIMQQGTFWIKNIHLTITQAQAGDMLPISVENQNGQDGKITVANLLKMAQNVTLEMLPSGTPAVGDEFSFSKEVSGTKTMHRATIQELVNLVLGLVPQSPGGGTLDVNALETVLPALEDLIAIADESDSWNLKKLTINALIAFMKDIFPTRADFEGYEDDLYMDYESVMLDTSIQDKRTQWCLTTDTSGAPQLTNQVTELSSVNDGTYTLVVSTILSTTSDNENDPNNPIAYDQAKTAADYPTGSVFYIHSQEPYDTKNYIKCTLTTDGTLVGTGNAAYIWATVSIDEVETFDDGDWFRLSTEVPSTLNIDIPVSAISNFAGRIDVAFSGRAARSESLKFKAVTDSVGGDPNTSRTLSLDGTTPVAVNYGQGSAEYISGTANASTFTVLKAGIYMISVSASIDIGTTDRAQPYFQIQKNSDSSSIGETPSKYMRYAQNNNIQYYETGFLIVDSDNTVCKLVALHDRIANNIHPTYTVDAGTILSLTRFL